MYFKKVSGYDVWEPGDDKRRTDTIGWICPRRICSWNGIENGITARITKIHRNDDGTTIVTDPMCRKTLVLRQP